MNPEALAVALIIIIIGFAILDFIVDVLNFINYNKNVPSSLSDLFSQEDNEKGKAYRTATFKLSSVSDAIHIATQVFLILFGFKYINDISLKFTQDPILLATIFIAIYMAAETVISLPLSYWSTFVVEEKFGFNKTTKITFVADLFKSMLMGAVITLPIVAAITATYVKFGASFWIYAFAIQMAVSIFFGFFYVSLIVPIFNKLTPLEDGPLRNAIKEYADKATFPLTNVFVIDGSKRSTKANAFFTGFGSKKTIVLYDTLIKECSTSEVVGVLAHEIGHYKKKHVIKGIVSSTITSFGVWFVFSLMIDNPIFSLALGVDQMWFHISAISLSILWKPASLVISIINNYSSRKHEYEADQYAKETYDSASLISSLKKLSKMDLANLTPHPLNVFLNYSHPTLAQRIEKLNES